MEEILENIGEQPDAQALQEESVNGSPIGEEVASDNMAETGEAERGVPVGKFKNVEDLMQAYDHLQAEFTRKCQRLSELEKKDKMSEENIEKKFENDFKTFLLNNQDAFAYAEEIKGRVEADESLKTQEGAFEKVWADMIYQKLSSPEREKDDFVQNLVLKDKNLENLIIENYMKQLQEQKTPHIMTTSSGERVTKVATPKPNSFEDAKKIVMDLLS